MCNNDCKSCVFRSRELHEECGIFAIATAGDTSVDVREEVRYGLYALQHRGQEGCGISVNDRGVITTHKGLGLVPDVMPDEELCKLPRGQMAIGHTRYATTGSSNIDNTQPIFVRHAKGTLALAHNGNITNAAALRERYQNRGVIFHTTNDSEIIAYTIAKQRLDCHSIEEAVRRSMDVIEGAYSLVILSPQKMIAVRDPNGFRPLVIGRLKNGGYVFASETCALDAVNAEYVRDIEAGEIVVYKDGKITTYKQGTGKPKGLCIFEFIYFARPDSVIEGQSVHEARKNAGRLLAKAHPVDADVIIGAPDSGLDAAQGYAEESGIPYGVGLLKNRYIGRTFIQPSQSQRENSVKIKLNAIKSTLQGKRVVLVDDSIVRGTTMNKTVKLVRDAGAAEVHVRITAPPFVAPCYFGVDVDSKDNLIACKLNSVEEIAKAIGADSLGYLSIEDAKLMAKDAGCGFCMGCFTDEYPVNVDHAQTKDKFEEKILSETGYGD